MTNTRDKHFAKHLPPADEVMSAEEFFRVIADYGRHWFDFSNKAMKKSGIHKISQRDQAIEARARKAALEEAALAIEEAKCPPGCDKFGHEELCSVVYPENAIRALVDKVAK